MSEKRNLSPVRRDEPTEPQASTERWERGKPEGKPQGGTEGSRENAERRDRGPGASPARGARPEWARGSVLRWSVVRHGGFPGAAGAGSGGGCPTRPRRGASGSSLTWPRGAREASAERLLGVASRPGPVTLRPARRRLDCAVAGAAAQRSDDQRRGRAFAGGHLAVQLRLHQGEVVGMGHPDAAALRPPARRTGWWRATGPPPRAAGPPTPRRRRRRRPWRPGASCGRPA